MSLFRSLACGVGGLIAVTVAMGALENTIASRPNAPKIEAPATSFHDFTAEVDVARDDDEQATNDPAFASEGVTIAHASVPEEREFAGEETIVQERALRHERIDVRQAAERQRPAQRLRQQASEPRVVSSEVETASAEDAEASRYRVQRMRNEAAEAREYEEAAEAAYEEENDTRSWFGSSAYRREVEQRRRTEREAQRRRL